MQMNDQVTVQQATQTRPDPTGFVMSVAVTLFVLTVGAVITMHLATQHGWQVL
jgi:hypothetical protein